jgi:hypothetical protein
VSKYSFLAPSAFLLSFPMGSCVLRETIRKGRPRFAPRVSLSIFLEI